jgi:purine-nucleoside phosphorylase
MMRDQLNLSGTNPVEGEASPATYGARFADLRDLYGSTTRARIRDIVVEAKEVVYAGLRGPHFETPAEIFMARATGQTC